MTPLPPRFGRPITADEANDLFKRFIDIKSRSAEKIREALKGDDEAIRYYCGRPDFQPECEDLAFIFDKQSLTQILKKVLSSEADGFVIFNGARSNDSIGSDGQSTDISGRPTLMIFPCKFEEATEAGRKDDVDVINLLNDGEQHPGTGGLPGDSNSTRPTTLPSELPVVFRTGDIHKIG